MITGEIKIHDEPLPYTNTTYHTHVETPAQKKAWEDRCLLDLTKAKALCSVGDSIKVKNNIGSTIIITEFIELPANMQRYQENPCILKGLSTSYQQGYPIQYALAELDWDTLQRFNETKEEQNGTK